MALSKSVRDQLELVLPNTKKNLSYLKSNDWSSLELSNKQREQIYNRCNLITGLAIDSANKIYSIAGDELNDPAVKKAFELFIEFYTLQEKRYYKLMDEKDWTVWDQGTPEEEILLNAEIDFQSEVLKSLSAQKEKLRKINFGGTDDESGVPVKGHDKVPLAMRKKVEEKYPQITKIIEDKEE